jgi:hypothetical protein
LIAVVLFILSAAICGNSSAASPVSPEEGRQFFERYIALDGAFDPEFVTLYSDDTRVRFTRHLPTGQAQEIVVDGAQWKNLLIKLLALAKARNDRSEYRDPRYDREGDKLRIRADRYSLRKCYWDKRFYILLTRRPNGAVYIEEQFFEVRVLPDC